MNATSTFKPAGPGRDYIEITAAGQPVRAVTVPSARFTIGRSSKNAISINDERASRRHVEVTFDGTKYSVMDLNSKNGSFLAGAPLLPQLVQEWHTYKELRIGEHKLRLVSTPAKDTQVPPPEARSSHSEQRTAQKAPPPSKAQRAESARIRREENIELKVTDPNISVSPGTPATLQVGVINLSDEVVHCTISVSGIPSEWVKVAPNATLKLLNKAETVVTVIIQPPASIRVRAGRFRYHIEAKSQDPQDPVAKVEGRITIASFGNFEAELRQQVANVGATLRVLVKNKSNTSQQFTISCWDEADVLRFTIPQKNVTIPAGSGDALAFSAVPRRKRWVGGVKEHSFNAKVTSKDGGEVTTRGKFVSRGVFPTWLPPLVLALLLGALGAGRTLYVRQQNIIATETAVAIAQSETAIAAAAATQTIEHENLVATTAAETATAVWNAQDTDLDGLINQRELDLGLSSTSADSDGDGLRDGDELEEYHTDPLDDDTDSDGLKDGAEIERGIDPLNRDTDGDGLPDNTDPDPIRLPTATPDLAATATVYAKQTEDARSFIAIQTATQEAKDRIATATAEAEKTQVAGEQAARDATATAEKQKENAEATRQQGERDQQGTATAAQQTSEARQAAIAKQTADARATEAARPTPTPTLSLMNMDLNAYCRSRGYSGASNNGSTVYNWYCVGSGSYLTDADYNQLCQEQYSTRAYAIYANRNDRNSWKCVVP